ncbi:hypothetical protein EVG20_g7756 [Dentipellis fragilis]|uniref:Uncharacterized protein n=1 Tax=Dentipellis fragilis TaxID=205917 RepID=A0A4Y9YB58_9AGAM|nr:hypothetical protein EVG20_g7756 [Dentipellis fragilis]
MAIAPLPPYPPSRTRASLSPSQVADLHQKIARALHETLSLPPPKRDIPQTAAFISSYARDAAQEILQTLIWDTESPGNKSHELSGDAKVIRNRVLLLAERVAPSGLLDLATLLDLTVVYTTHLKRLRALFLAAVQASKTPQTDLNNSVVPAFASVLSQISSIGLYGLRKSVHCLLCFLHVATPDFIRAFARDKEFMILLARAYDSGLTSLAQSYGGLHFPTNSQDRPLDDWERILLETKVALLDIFHALLKTMLADMTRATGPALAAESERTFDIVFALLELPAPQSASAGPSASTPFLDRSLLVDYQHAHDLSRLLETTLSQAAADDARLEFITTSLRALDSDADAATHNPGALKFLLGSGVPPGIDNLGRGQASRRRAPSPPPPPGQQQQQPQYGYGQGYGR